MDKQTQEVILKWIFDNHQHHSEADLNVDSFQTICDDGDQPYVNSLELEKFILNLGVKS